MFNCELKKILENLFFLQWIFQLIENDIIYCEYITVKNISKIKKHAYCLNIKDTSLKIALL